MALLWAPLPSLNVVVLQFAITEAQIAKQIVPFVTNSSCSRCFSADGVSWTLLMGVEG